MKRIIRNGTLVNEGMITVADVLINKGRIIKIESQIEEPNCEEIDAEALWVMPGIIDDQVHFREPGLTHKANIYTESRAAAAGGVTSFMEMPNVKPPSVTQDLLAKKYDIGASDSLVNYSFFMGVSNENLDEVLRTNPKQVCGLKIFMGSSTGNMLVDNDKVLESIFSRAPMLIATHCEDEATISRNLEMAREKWGEDVPFEEHPIIRSVEACYLSSSKAIELAKKHDTRLHILHLTTDKELDLFDNSMHRSEKRITSEVCVHHLYFDATQYSELGSKIKCNPAIKEPKHKKALMTALLDGRLDIIATDHAPHTAEEKSKSYFGAPSGLPLIQHTLNVMLEFCHDGLIDIQTIVDKMCHAPADVFKVEDRGYLREGFFADIILVDPDAQQPVNKDNILYKCGWSPFEGKTFRGKVMKTLVNGEVVWDGTNIIERKAAHRLSFDRVIV